VIVVAGMTYFNNNILPESNFRAKALWYDIRAKKPGFALEEGRFYDGLRGYSIRAMNISESADELGEITIFDYTQGNQSAASISAHQGRLEPRPNDIFDLILENGELHRRQEQDERYERIKFTKYRMRFDVSDLSFERSDPSSVSRSDRTTRTSLMQHLVDSLETNIQQRRQSLHEAILQFTQPTTDQALLEKNIDDTVEHAGPVKSWLLQGLTRKQALDVYDRSLNNARSLRAEIDNTRSAIEWAARRADRYRVEIHKKYSIAVACLVFLLIGAPLGLRIRRGGLGIVCGLSVGIFLFYWITLVQGEKLADRGFLEPWIGMWAANLLIGGIAVFLFVYMGLDLRNRSRWLRRANG
jgi:lipopolysaccharide export system permease protein